MTTISFYLFSLFQLLRTFLICLLYVYSLVITYFVYIIISSVSLSSFSFLTFSISVLCSVPSDIVRALDCAATRVGIPTWPSASVLILRTLFYVSVNRCPESEFIFASILLLLLQPFTLKMEAARFSKTSVRLSQNIRRHIPEDSYSSLSPPW
jgi:hypothetical protein